MTNASNNVAHSSFYGVYVDKLISRTYPCRNFKNPANADPWADNLPIQSIVSNYTIYKCQNGFAADSVGYAAFVNLTIADYQGAGFAI